MPLYKSQKDKYYTIPTYLKYLEYSNSYRQKRMVVARGCREGNRS